MTQGFRAPAAQIESIQLSSYSRKRESKATVVLLTWTPAFAGVMGCALQSDTDLIKR